MRRKIDRKKLKELYLKGLSDREIAKELNCCIDSVKLIRYSLGLLKRKHRKGIKDKIIKLWKNGLKPSEIAYIVKCTPQYVYTVTIRYGLRMPVIRPRKDYLTTFLRALQSGPKFANELKKLGIRNPIDAYRQAIIRGYAVRRFRLHRG